jgi:hypothetical protein
VSPLGSPWHPSQRPLVAGAQHVEDTPPEGLSYLEAATRLRHFGPNEMYELAPAGGRLVPAHLLRELRTPAACVIWLAILLQLLQALRASASGVVNDLGGSGGGGGGDGVDAGAGGGAAAWVDAAVLLLLQAMYAYVAVTQAGRRRTRHSAPVPFRPASCTGHPELTPYTLNHTLQIVHPIHPTPYTLHPSP